MLSHCYLLTGQNYLAKPLIDRLQLVDPFTPLSSCMPGWYHLLNGDFERAKAPYESMLAMNPDNPIARLFAIWVYALNHDKKKIEITFQGFNESDKTTFPFTLAKVFYEQSSDLELTDRFTDIALSNEMYSRFTAFAYAASSNIELATFWLEKAFELGFSAYPFLKHHDPFFKPYHQHPVMQKLLDKIERKWQSYIE